MDAQRLYDAVSRQYSAVSLDPAKSTGGYGKAVAQSFGYAEDDLDSIPTESNLGLSCGNPLAIAGLNEGETVIDLGSGGGFDVFLAARKVGPTGRAIGIDMNEDMVALAERNKAQSGASNVSFVHSRITSTPLGDATADAIISNCVINLVPEAEKPLVFKEMFRLLKPGGRVAVSDILTKKELPEALRSSVAAYVGCIAGASLASQYEMYLGQAGFSDVLIEDANSDLNVYIDILPDGSRRAKDENSQDGQAATGCKKIGGCCAMSKEPVDEPAGVEQLVAALKGVDLNEWAGSFKVYAIKP